MISEKRLKECCFKNKNCYAVSYSKIKVISFGKYSLYSKGIIEKYNPCRYLENPYETNIKCLMPNPDRCISREWDDFYSFEYLYSIELSNIYEFKKDANKALKLEQKYRKQICKKPNKKRIKNFLVYFKMKGNDLEIEAQIFEATSKKGAKILALKKFPDEEIKNIYKI